jgi:hypothetical protein
MNYQLSENELNRLESCVNQIDFVTYLCSHVEGCKEIPVSGLQSFLSAQQEALQATIKAAEARHEAQRTLDAEQGALHWFDWLSALRIARGDAQYTPKGAEVRITEKLQKAARIDGDMAQVVEEWAATLAAQGLAQDAAGQ